MCEYCGYNSKLFWPLTLIFVGAAIMMVNVGVLPASILKLWPIALVVIGLVGLSSTCDNCKHLGFNGKPLTTKKKKSKR